MTLLNQLIRLSSRAPNGVRRDTLRLECLPVSHGFCHADRDGGDRRTTESFLAHIHLVGDEQCGVSAATLTRFPLHW